MWTMRQVDSPQVEEPTFTLQEPTLFTQVFRHLLLGDSLEPLLASSTMTKKALNLPLPSTHWLISEDFPQAEQIHPIVFLLDAWTQRFL